MTKKISKKPTVPVPAPRLSDFENFLGTLDCFEEARIEELEDAVRKSGAAGARKILESFVREAKAAIEKDLPRVIEKTLRRGMV